MRPTWAPRWCTSRAPASINRPKDAQSLSKPQNHTHPARKGFRTTLVGILVSIVLAIGKGAAGIFGHSFALIADAVESVGDIFTASVMYLGLKKAAQPPDQDHPYGHGKAEPIAALAVLLALRTACATMRPERCT